MVFAVELSLMDPEHTRRRAGARGPPRRGWPAPRPPRRSARVVGGTAGPPSEPGHQHDSVVREPAQPEHATSSAAEDIGLYWSCKSRTWMVPYRAGGVGGAP